MEKRLYITSIFFSLCIFLTGCLNNEGESSQSFVGEPLVVLSTEGAPVLKSKMGDVLFQAPMLAGKVEKGDCLLADFTIKFEKQTSPYTISELRNDEPVPQIGATPTEDLKAATEEAFPDTILGVSFPTNGRSQPILIENKLFFMFQQKRGQGDAFAYKMTYALPVGETPSLYVSAMGNGKENPGEERDVYTHYAFDMTEFIKAARKNNSTTISFALRYRATLEAEENETIFENYSTNNLQIEIDTTKIK